MIKWFAGAILKLYHQGTYKQQSQHDNNQSNRWSCKEILDKCRKYRNGRRIQCYTWYDRGELPPYHSWCSKLGWMKSIVCMLWPGGTPPVPQLVLQTGMKNEKHWSENPARTWVSWDITSCRRWCDEPNESRTCKQKMRMSCEELQRALKWKDSPCSNVHDRLYELELQKESSDSNFSVIEISNKLSCE